MCVSPPNGSAVARCVLPILTKRDRLGILDSDIAIGIALFNINVLGIIGLFPTESAGIILGCSSFGLYAIKWLVGYRMLKKFNGNLTIRDKLEMIGVIVLNILWIQGTLSPH